MEKSNSGLIGDNRSTPWGGQGTRKGVNVHGAVDALFKRRERKKRFGIRHGSDGRNPKLAELI